MRSCCLPRQQVRSRPSPVLHRDPCEQRPFAAVLRSSCAASAGLARARGCWLTSSYNAPAEAIGSKRKDVAGVFLLTGAPRSSLVIAIVSHKDAVEQQRHELSRNAGPADAVKHLGPDIAGLLGGKGGGRPGMYSGKATLLERREQATNLLHTLKDGHRKG